MNVPNKTYQSRPAAPLTVEWCCEGLAQSFDAQPLPRFDSEALGFRVVSESSSACPAPLLPV